MREESEGLGEGPTGAALMGMALTVLSSAVPRTGGGELSEVEVLGTALEEGILSRNEKNEPSSSSSSLLLMGVVGLLLFFVRVYGTNVPTLGVVFEGLVLEGGAVGGVFECLGFGSRSFKLLRA